MKKNKNISLLSIVISTLLLVNCFSIYIHATPENIYKYKIDKQLLTMMDASDDGDLIPISVWLQPVDLSKVETNLQATYGISSEHYSNMQSFENTVVKELYALEASELEINIDSRQQYSNNIVNLVRDTYNINNVLSDEEIARCINDGMKLIDIAKLGKQQEYISKWRDSVVDIQKPKNNNFLNNLNNLKIKCHSLEMFDNSSWITMRVKKDDIVKIASIDDVLEINHYVAPNFFNLTSISSNSNQQKMNILTAQNTFFSSNYGSGIKIGILEYVSSGAYDSVGLNPNYPHVANSIGSRIIRLSNPHINSASYTSGVYEDHGAYMTSIAAGDSVTISGITYRGVAPNATVYFTQFDNNAGSRSGIQLLLDNNVNVINCSFQDLSSGGYSDLSKYYDEQININKVTICIASGNTFDDTYGYKISSTMAYSYNSIVVGNADLTEQLLNGNFVSIGSKYQQDQFPYSTNKPDLVAAGEYITLANHDETGIGSGICQIGGTSPATSFVTGVVALMMQKNSWLISNPMAIKAILSVSADTNLGNIIQVDTNTLLYDRSGAGLLDAYSAVYAVVNEKFASITRRNVYSTDTVYRAIGPELYLEAGDKVRVAVTFMKTTNEILNLASSPYGANVDIALYNDDSGLIVATANSTKHNVEIFEYTATTAGTYYIQYKLVGVPSTPFDLQMGLSWEVY